MRDPQAHGMIERPDDNTLQVIGAGFGRCGTTSLARALEMLGYGPCYHMQVAMLRYFDMKFWVRAAAGEPVDFRHFFRKYRATVDWPSCEFYQQLMAAYPDAKVLLNTREPESWYESTRETLWKVDQALPWWVPKVMRRMHFDIVWNGRFKGAFADRAKALEIFNGHLDEVRRTVPPDRLLEWDVKQGWGPLCRFLGKPLPPADVPFPHHNDRRFFRRLLLALRIAEWLVPALVVAGLAWAGWTFWRT